MRFSSTPYVLQYDVLPYAPRLYESKSAALAHYSAMAPS
jgi:hypothetical protein